MKSRRLWASTIVALLLVSVYTTSASAQLVTPTRSSSNGVFGSRGQSTSERNQLDLTGSLFGGYDNDALTDLGSSPSDLARLGGSAPMVGGNASLSFRRPGDRMQMSAAANVGLTHTRKFVNTAASYSARGGLSGSLGRRSTINVAAQFGFSPRYGVASRLFEAPDDLGVPVIADGLQDLDLIPAASYRQWYRASFSQTINRRASLGVSYGLQRTAFSEVPRDLTAHRASIEYRHSLTQHATARLGYGYYRSTHESLIQGSTPFPAHQLIASVDYSRDFSLFRTRRTVASFGMGSLVAQTQEFRGDVSGDPRPRVYLTGNAQLTHEMGRTWTAAATYGRGLRFIDGFRQPVIADTVNGTVSGLLSRRLQFAAVAMYGTGVNVGSDQRFHSYRYSAQVSAALSRHVSLFSQAFYIQQRGRIDDAPEELIPSNLARYGVRAGISLWTSLLD